MDLKIWNVFGVFAVCCIVCACEQSLCDNNLSKYVKKKVGLVGSQTWSGKAQDVENCMLMCVRRKTCNSIDYDFSSNRCDLNTGDWENTPTESSEFMVYSQYEWWPSSFDPHCYSRPCGDDEVCIPGGGTAGTCSFTCMKAGRTVCPMPSFGLSGGRYVGDENDFTCGHGYTGSDTATCKSTGEWDKDIDPECEEIHGHECSSNNFCSSINAICKNDNCACPSYLEYNSGTLMCVCPSPPSAVSASYTLSEDESGSTTATYECEDGYTPKTASGDPTRMCSPSTGWQPINNYECYKCDDPPAIAGATLGDLAEDGTRTYTCGPEPIRQKLNADSGTIRCLETGDWQSTNFKCTGIRFQPNTDPSRMYAKTMVGYLEIFKDGWHSACVSDWTWRQTKIVCEREGYMFAGSFHQNWYDEKDEHKDAVGDAQESYKVKDLTCDQDETGKSLCSYRTENCDHDKDMVITCFNYTDAEDDVTLDGEELYVVFNGEKKPLCEKDWGDTETEISCKTLNPAWSRDSDGHFRDSSLDAFAKDTECSGSEPHLFFCQNKGWGYGDNCHDDKLVRIRCND